MALPPYRARQPLPSIREPYWSESFQAWVTPDTSGAPVTPPPGYRPPGRGGITIGIGTGTGTGSGDFPGTGTGIGEGYPRGPGPIGSPTPSPTTPGGGSTNPGGDSDTPPPPRTGDGFDWGKFLRDLLTGQGGTGQQGQGQGGALPAIAALARILQGLNTGRAAGRISEANMARLYDYLNLARTRTYYDRAGQELDQRKFAQDLQNDSYGNALRSTALQNARPGPSITAPPEMAGFVPRGTGLRMGDLPQDRRDEIGGAMYRNAITELLDPLQPGTATSGRRMAALPEPDPISPTPEAGWFDDTLSWLGPILNGLVGMNTTTPTPTAPATDNVPGTPDPRRSDPNRMAPEVETLPKYKGDVNLGDPRTSLASNVTPGPGSPYGPTSAATSLSASSGLTGSQGGLPPISSLVPGVPPPTAPLSPYDPYGRRRGMPDLYGRST